MHLHLAVCLLREHVDAYGYDKIGSRVSRFGTVFLVFYLFAQTKKGTKEEKKLVCTYFENERISFEKNQSNLIGLLVDSLNYEPHSHVLPYSETHWGQILSSNRI